MLDEKEVRENIKNLKFAKTVTVDGIEYTLQKLPVRPALKLRQDCKKDGEDDIKLYEELLENVVIHPKKKLDDFEDVGHLDALMTKVIDYQYRGK